MKIERIAMSNLANESVQHYSGEQPKKIIVIGAGPVGVRFAHELRKKNIACEVTLFGNEAYEPYNRVQLSNLLSRSKDYDDILTELPVSTGHFIFNYRQQHIKQILPEEKKVITRGGETYAYDELVLATGSTPFVPNIEGADMTGVYTFRNLRDAEALMTRSLKSRKIIVVGGGLLGLEAARALKKHHTEVVLMQQADRLMNRQLDEKAGDILKEYVESLGIWVDLSAGVRGIIGEERVEGVITRDGNVIECDTVLFCTGIRPSIDLAQQAGLHVARGILVNDELQTSKENIYAIGECCEHKGVVYGIFAPGLEQAAIVADNFANGTAQYHGTQLISTLKVVGQSVCSMGEVAEVTRRAKQSLLTYQNKKTGDYRKIIVHQGRIIGACAVGDWPENRRVQEAFLSQSRLSFWQAWYIKLTGKMWMPEGDKNIAAWPEAAIICQCNQISRGEISEAIAANCQSVESIGKATGAGTVCGSCQPLLQNMLGQEEKAVSVKGGIPILIASILAAFASILFFAMPGIASVDSVQTPSYEYLWTDGWWKQATGFTLIGLVAIGLIMSLRKHFGWTFLGQFSYWRVLHALLGVLALAVLLAHTGAHLGENANRWLMINFLVVSGLGALAGVSLWLAGQASASTVQALKKGWYWAHLIVVWPLPALLIVHIFTVYYY